MKPLIHNVAPKGPLQFVTQTPAPSRKPAVNAVKRDPMEYAPLLQLVRQSIPSDPANAGKILGMVANAAVAGGIGMDRATLQTRLALGDPYTVIQALRMAGSDRLSNIFN